MALALENPSLLSLAAGFTDNATLPARAVLDANKRLIEATDSREFLQYGSNQGRPMLRRALARRLAQQERGIDEADAERSLFVTNGSQQALYLAVQVLCDPGDIVLVDRPSYFVFLEMLTGLGVRARSLPVDGAGKLDLKALQGLLAEMTRTGDIRRLKAVYFVSYFSNPSARSLTEAEKTGLAETLLSVGACVPVLEDAAYRDLYYEKAWEARSVLTLPAWATFPRLYLSTLTKPFATGMKVGYAVCSDESWLKRMLHVKGHHDFGTANYNQALFEILIEGREFEDHLRGLRPAYQRKMKTLHETLMAEGLTARGWTWDEPAGGLYLWLRAPVDRDTGLTSAFCRACVEEGVLYVPGELCFGDDAPQNYVRLSFGVLSSADLERAGKRFAAVAKRLT